MTGITKKYFFIPSSLPSGRSRLENRECEGQITPTRVLGGGLCQG
jgi:hypothetical protein